MTEITDARIDAAIELFEAFPKDWKVEILFCPDVGDRVVLKYRYQELYNPIVIKFVSDGPEILKDLAIEIRRLRKREEEARGLITETEILRKVEIAARHLYENLTEEQKLTADANKMKINLDVLMFMDRVTDCALSAWLKGD